MSSYDSDSAHFFYEGGCKDLTGIGVLATVIILQFVESLFLTICCTCLKFTLRFAFFELTTFTVCYAVWRSSGSPVDQARLSLHPSFDGKEKDNEADMSRKESEDAASRRGWWDYVPDNQQYLSTLEQGSSDAPGLLSRFWQWLKSEIPPSVAFQRKPSLPGDQPIPHPPRVSIVSGGSIAPPRLSKASFSIGLKPFDSSSPPSTSVMRRWITRVPGVEAFRKMLKNEVCGLPCIRS